MTERLFNNGEVRCMKPSTRATVTILSLVSLSHVTQIALFLVVSCCGPIQVLKDFGFVVQLYLVLLSKALVQIDHRVVKLTPMSLNFFQCGKISPY